MRTDSGRARRPTPRPLSLESLEDRRLLSGAAPAAGWPVPNTTPAAADLPAKAAAPAPVIGPTAGAGQGTSATPHTAGNAGGPAAGPPGPPAPATTPGYGNPAAPGSGPGQPGAYPPGGETESDPASEYPGSASAGQQNMPARTGTPADKSSPAYQESLAMQGTTAYAVYVADVYQASQQPARQVAEAAVLTGLPAAPSHAVPAEDSAAVRPAESVPVAEAGTTPPVQPAVAPARARAESNAPADWLFVTVLPRESESGPELLALGPALAPPAVAAGEAFLPLAGPGGLLVGAVSADLSALERAADEFFARLEGLADDLGGSATLGVPSWFLTAAVWATATYEFARRRALARTPHGPAGEGGDDPDWDPSPVLAVLPPGG